MQYKKSRLASGGKGNYRSDAAHVGERKRLRKQAEGAHPGRPTKWEGGVLCFCDTLEPVPGVKHVPKQGTEARGPAAARQASTPKPSWSQQAAIDEAARRRGAGSSFGRSSWDDDL